MMWFAQKKPILQKNPEENLFYDFEIITEQAESITAEK